MKLDPRRPNDPLVRSFPITERVRTTRAARGPSPRCTDGWSTPRPTAGTGTERWRIHLAGPTWSSPVPVDDVLLQGDCRSTRHAFDVAKPFKQAPELWSLSLGSCIESTPSVFDDRIWVGTRGGAIYGIGDRRDVA